MLGFLKSFSSNIYYNYSVQSHPAFESGCWTVYDAIHKTTNEPASVFVLNKKKVAESMVHGGDRLRTSSLSEIWDYGTRGVQHLTKIRHPAVLRLIDPLENTKGSLKFVTERVVGTVETLKVEELDDLSVVRGLTTIVEALQFLHSQIGMAHLSITPRTLFVDAQGDWKLAGLEFLTSFEEHAAGTFQLPILDPRLPSYVHPPYDYLAPELVMGRTVVPANDVWSLSCVLFAIYVRRSPLKLRNNPSAYREELAQFWQSLKSPQVSNKFPHSLRPYVDSLFCEDPDGRITLQVLTTTNYFQNPLSKALKSMDDYSAKQPEEKVSFLKHFATLIPQFPKQMRIRKITKFATKELSGPRDPTTATLMGNVLFTVCADMSRLSFQEQVLPVFSKLTDFLSFQESVAANLEVVARNTNDKDFCKSVLPLIVDALKHHDVQHVALQTQILSRAEVYGDNLTIPKLEQVLFPSVIDCFAATAARGVKVAATECLVVLVKKGVSKALISDRLIPALHGMKTRDPVVVVAVGKLWDVMCSRMNSEQIFTLALPSLLDISLANKLTVDQFNLFMGIIRGQIDHVAKDQVKTLVHNMPEQDDDWLNETSETVNRMATIPTTTQTSALLKPNKPVSPLPAPAPTSDFMDTLPRKEAKPAPLPKTTPAKTMDSSVKPIQKLQTLPRPQQSAPAIVPASTTPSFPSLQPADKNSPMMMAPLVPTSQSTNVPTFTPMQPTTLQPMKLQPTKVQPKPQDNDEFGSFMTSPESNFDSLI